MDPAAIRLGLLDGHYRQDRMWTDAVLEAALARLARWRSATALSAGPAAHDTIARLRQPRRDRRGGGRAARRAPVTVRFAHRGSGVMWC
ncbi:cysteinyl-tRNA synthetase MshC [Mycobacteroides abscessus subsp. abscessus]|nr:cysteinyl-tRNA synthetase MshC [Mycobacteroides abscessus subsp. abscessus]